MIIESTWFQDFANKDLDDIMLKNTGVFETIPIIDATSYLQLLVTKLATIVTF